MTNGQRRVLVVEDEADVAALLQLVVSRFVDGASVEHVADARKVMKRLTDGERWSLILSDLMMPGLDGGTFLKNLAADPVLSDVRVMIISAVDPGRMEELMELPNVVAAVQKPVDPLSLAAKVTALLNA